MKFDDYDIAPEIRRNLSDLGFKKPTDIQYKSILPIIAGDDLLAIAQTGSGKTAAFAIPIIDIIHDRKKSKTSRKTTCLVMVPTRELANQLTLVFKQIAKGTKVKISSVYGGVEQDHQISQLEKGTDVVIATPGRMFDLHHQGYIKLDEVELLVLDEVGYLPIDQHGADLLFQVISQRYERGSIVLTTNKPFKQWASIFNNDSTIASAVLDRLLHHAETVVIEAKSFRMKDRVEGAS